jgi:hypothetical protein
MREEHGMAVRSIRLEPFDGIVLLRDAIGSLGHLGSIQSVDLLSQNSSFE